MKRFVLIALAGLLLVALAVPALAAVGTDDEIAALEQQIRDLQKQLIDKYVAAGRLTPEQGKFMQDRLDAVSQWRAANPNATGWWCPGWGTGMGPGMMWGGRGFGWGGGPPWARTQVQSR
jgi:hypothetical protein